MKKLRLISLTLTICILFSCMMTAGAATTSGGVCQANPGYYYRTKQDVIDKYNELKPKVSVQNYSDVFEVIPSAQSPYVAGKMKTAVLQDGLNALNYYRWLAGLTTVELDEVKSEEAQYGAVVLAANNQFAHEPTNAVGMPTDFFNRGFAITSTSNLSMTKGGFFEYLFSDDIKGYFDDVYNVTPLSVGHRLSLMQLKTSKAAFAHAQNGDSYYGIANLNRDDAIVCNQADFYSWPSPGYFPTEAIDRNALWNISLNGPTVPSTGDITVTITNLATNATYIRKKSDGSVKIQPHYNDSLVFAAPGDIAQGQTAFGHGERYSVAVTGLLDAQDSPMTIEYQTSFFSIQTETDPHFALAAGSNAQMDINRGYLVGIEPGTAASDYASIITSDFGEVLILDDEDYIINSGYLKTGLRACLIYDNRIVSELRIVIYGDINGDGTLNSLDQLNLKSHSLGISLITGVPNIEAADVNHDGTISSIDNLTLSLAMVGNGKIVQTKG